MNGPQITEYILNNGFVKVRERGFEQFTAMKRIHEIHWLVWYEELKHFGLAVESFGRSAGAGRQFHHFTTIVIPRCMYTVDDVNEILAAFRE